jgi:PAS domain S-box-containing protein
MMDNLNDGLYIADRDRIITYRNRAAERVTGYSAGEVIGPVLFGQYPDPCGW